MSRLGLTGQERSLVAQIAAQREPRFHRLWFYSATLFPVLGFGVYGLVRGDLVALGLGFGGLLLFCGWLIAGELNAAPVFTSLCEKVDAFERAVDA